jgi:hypothetical protein
MIAPEPTSSQGPDPADSQVTTGKIDSSEGPVTTLRGAGVDVDIRRVAPVAIGICLAGVAVLAVILLVSGFHKNAQIANLRQHGVPVEMKVTGCIGLMGGSGSNLAGYQCRAAFTLDGQTSTENIPGSNFLATGSTHQGVAVPGDPALVSTPSAVAAEHASWRVFLIPAILLVVLVGILEALFLRQRRVRAAPRVDRVRTGSPSPALDHRS